MPRATGTFEITMNAQPPYDTAEGTTLGRASFDKTFHGDLQGQGRVEMLSALTSVQGSAAYVALERITGALAGREGSFIVLHTGVMERGKPTLSVTVVPDSASGGLRGLGGKLEIQVIEKQHHYTFDYEIAG